MFKHLIWQGAIALGAALHLAMTPLVAAQTVSPSEADTNAPPPRSTVVPSLLDYPGPGQVLGIRCLHSSRTSRVERLIQRDPSMRVTQDDSSTSVSIAVPGECDEVVIHLHPFRPTESRRIVDDLLLDHHFPERSRHSDWLIREGSGWYWLLNR
ncbi:hypothetical protein IQ268_21770 [Oculatella sp. LEGE 06141]|uniref:hypothetical protein n=1 Tax=Oculatella sp. LEGE 06141 TaxID=1828648 RepID=UPI00187EE51C|nr:hypothetical protein [Oculatella sp. LEGE 06141]MBE9181194.1 hypothetical protein [Oculatella sp. LEGE 06141]